MSICIVLKLAAPFYIHRVLFTIRGVAGMPTHTIIDSHCHLDFEVFDADRQALIEHCHSLGISHFIVPGVSHRQWSKLITICADNLSLDLALGLHPMFMKQHQPSDIEALKWALTDYPAVAVGEIGLDFYDKSHDKTTQISLFTSQLELAIEFDLPVILHVRKAHDEVLKLLKQYPVKGGMVHAFSGNMQQAEHYQKRGFLFGAGGSITYPRASKTRDVFSQLAIESLLLETDSPDMPLKGQQGQRNTPKNLLTVLSTLAELRGEEESALAAASTANCQRLFNLNDRLVPQ